jgi:hypothetical protein
MEVRTIFFGKSRGGQVQSGQIGRVSVRTKGAFSGSGLPNQPLPGVLCSKAFKFVIHQYSSFIKKGAVQVLLPCGFWNRTYSKGRRQVFPPNSHSPPNCWSLQVSLPSLLSWSRNILVYSQYVLPSKRAGLFRSPSHHR